eukprot:CAMPEP_0119396586 /NCGR_PEP_ID=MMETSP1334-20130426/137539_1 /TAXON_ID=127549 /ORGANISM="Calcidiscus leptoporus, Strain RCC1130" /LENGTH=85 /DNA_ID=CAMNT_0007420275 /DNA_START=123 /DNA_END=377 /DNA_ORIENTATION=-
MSISCHRLHELSQQVELVLTRGDWRVAGLLSLGDELGMLALDEGVLIWVGEGGNRKAGARGALGVGDDNTVCGGFPYIVRPPREQ